MIETRRADRNEHRGRPGQRQARRAEHDGGHFGRRRHQARRDGGDPYQQIALALFQHPADGVAVGIVVGRAAGIADAQRIAADPGAHGGGGDRPFGAAERQPGKARGLIEVLDQAGELLDGEVGKGKVERGRRPHHHAVFGVAAQLGERVDLGQLYAVNLGRRDGEAAHPRSEQRHHVAGPLVAARQRDRPRRCASPWRRSGRAPCR